MRRGPDAFSPHAALILVMALVAIALGAQEADDGAGLARVAGLRGLQHAVLALRTGDPDPIPGLDFERRLAGVGEWAVG